MAPRRADSSMVHCILGKALIEDCNNPSILAALHVKPPDVACGWISGGSIVVAAPRAGRTEDSRFYVDALTVVAR